MVIDQETGNGGIEMTGQSNTRKRKGKAEHFTCQGCGTQWRRVDTYSDFYTNKCQGMGKFKGQGCRATSNRQGVN